jgi:imidazolonepropionase-like amidohydrolase
MCSNLIGLVAPWIGSLAFLVTFGATTSLGDIVILNARVVDGAGRVYERASVHIAGERIQAITTQDTSAVKASITIHAAGKTVLPGLIDAHVHLFNYQVITDDQTLTQYVAQVLPTILQAYLRHGITTIKSTGDPTDAVLDIRERLVRQTLPGPRLFVVGGLTAAGGHPAATLFAKNPWYRARAGEVDSLKEVQDLIQKYADKHVNAIKGTYQGSTDPEKPYVFAGTRIQKLPSAMMVAAIEAAHRNSLRVTFHTADLEDALAVVEAGADGLEHGVVTAELTNDRLATSMRERRAFYVPTLRAFELLAPGLLRTAMANLKHLADAGVPIALGTDTFGGAPSGLNSLKEAELMVRAGMTPAHVIQAATRNAAVHLGKQDELGTVERGKLADLVIVNGNPLSDIAALQQVQVVIKGGQIVFDARLR